MGRLVLTFNLSILQYFCFRNIEGKVVEIARLQEIFADKVLEQVCLRYTSSRNHGMFDMKIFVYII